jgi:D-amino-acid dehydrogenase
VVALGPWSPDFLRRFGCRVTMVRKRGYHRHYRPPRTLNVPLRDDAYSYAMAPMVSGLRLTTGADMTEGHESGEPIQLHRADRAARQLLDLGAPVENRPWEGTRPCMPNMLPVIGAVRKHKGLWMHFGHGHQGFTLGPATARMLAELMSGEKPFIDNAPFRLDR